MKPKRVMVNGSGEYHRANPKEPHSRVCTLMLVLLAFWVLAGGLAQAADTVPPTITVGPYGSYPLTYPPVQDGMAITDGMLRFRADVYDASNIFSAPTLTLDGNPLPAQIGHPEPGDDGEGDWDFTWWWVLYSGSIGNGTHTLVLTATDSLGNKATQTFGLNVGTLTTITEFNPVTYGGNLRPTISARVNTGLNPGSITLTLDGAPVAHTYDAMTGLVTYVPSGDLADESYHNVLLSVVDKSQAWKFYTTTYPDMADSNVGNCTSCHTSYTSAEWAWGSIFTPLPWEAVHASRVRFGGVWHEAGESDCWVCHKEGGYSGIEMKSGGFLICGQCHGRPGDWLGYGSGWYHGQHEGIKYAPFKRDPAIPVRVAENREMVDCIVCHQPGVIMLRTTSAQLASHDIPEMHKTPQPGCNNCHAQSLTREHARRTTDDDQPITCGTCHLSSNDMVVTAIERGNKDCFGCHDNFADHENFEHSASPDSGPVVIFADTDHDDAAWVGERPYFAVLVDCSTCHNNQLPAIHGNDCSTCHPTPYNTVQPWEGGCQQGGCHPSYHQDSTIAHLPFEDPYDGTNDCSRCHDSSFGVPQSKCLNCHAAYTPGDATPPVTTSNAQVEYYGPARIDFSISDNGKVGVGRTFYRLDGAAVTAGSHVLVSDPGSHELEFWSKDQYGNTELAPNNVSFSIVVDTTPPTTTSNAQSSYSQGATITLAATDDSSSGVKATYYRLNDGSIQTGTSVVIPATSGTITYTLTFWSEDWAGNIETEKSVIFTVTSGTGTLRLVWGNSDTAGSPCPGDPEANAAWTIRRGGSSGTLVASGSGGCPNWNGVNDFSVQAGSTPYFVTIDWWDSYNGYDEQTVFSNVYVTTPGQVVRLSY